MLFPCYVFFLRFLRSDQMAAFWVKSKVLCCCLASFSTWQSSAKAAFIYKLYENWRPLVEFFRRYIP